MSAPNVMAIHPIVGELFQSEPKWWIEIERHFYPRCHVTGPSYKQIHHYCTDPGSTWSLRCNMAGSFGFIFVQLEEVEAWSQEEVKERDLTRLYKAIPGCQFQGSHIKWCGLPSPRSDGLSSSALCTRACNVLHQKGKKKRKTTGWSRGWEDRINMVDTFSNASLRRV